MSTKTTSEELQNFFEATIVNLIPTKNREQVKVVFETILKEVKELERFKNPLTNNIREAAIETRYGDFQHLADQILKVDASEIPIALSVIVKECHKAMQKDAIIRNKESIRATERLEYFETMFRLKPVSFEMEDRKEFEKDASFIDVKEP